MKHLPLMAAAALLVALALQPAGAAPSCRGQWMHASWYGKESCVNKSNCRTANGERYTGADLTAAHRTYAFGTKLRVTYNGHTAVVRVNDRGPAKWTGRDLDLSKAAAQKVGIYAPGVGKVCVEKVK